MPLARLYAPKALGFAACDPLLTCDVYTGRPPPPWTHIYLRALDLVYTRTVTYQETVLVFGKHREIWLETGILEQLGA